MQFPCRSILKTLRTVFKVTLLGALRKRNIVAKKSVSLLLMPLEEAIKGCLHLYVKEW